MALHKRLKGKLSIEPKVEIKSLEDLSEAYTPGVAEPCLEIARDQMKVYDYTMKGNCVAVITDGTAVLGLGDIGPEASLPVMEGKSLLMKEFAGIDSFPIALNTKDVGEIVETVKRIAPVFGAINLEDISSPRCFEVEERLQGIGIPVMHDDQHGTTVVVLAALINALEVVGKGLGQVKVVINGAGAAGTSVCRQLSCRGYDFGICTRAKDILILDSKGIIYRGRNDLDAHKQEMAEITNMENKKGTLRDALKGADVFIGVSRAGLVDREMVASMAPKAVVFAMANPVPEIMPQEAIDAGAAVVGTGRSDFPNQINNVLAFPGIFRGALDAKATRITPGMRMAASFALAKCVEKPSKDSILPSPLDKEVVPKVSGAVFKKAIEEKVVRE